MKNFYALTVCILICLAGMAQNYTYQAWVPSMGPLTFNTLGDDHHPWVQCKTSNSWNNPTNIVYPSNTSISNPSSSATSHAIITSNQEDPCRCYSLGQTTYPHDRYLPPSWNLDYNNLQDTVIRIGCGSANSTCNRAAQIEYWFYPEEKNNTLLVMFSFASINACGNWCSHGVDINGCASITNPQFYIEVFDGETGNLLELGHYPTQASQGSASPVDNPNWPYSQFLAWPSGCNAGSDDITGPDAYGINTYYWAGQTNSNGSSNANGFATPTSFDYRECPENQTGGNSDGYPVQWFEYKPLAFNLKSIASQNVDANGNFTPVKSVKLRIHTVGCSATAHWAYGLFTAKMIPGTVQVITCGNEPILLSVPHGFMEQTYEWHYGYDSLDALNRTLDFWNLPPGFSIQNVYDLFIDPDAAIAAGSHVWPYYCCRMRSYTGVPFVFEYHLRKYHLDADFGYQPDSGDVVRFQDLSSVFYSVPPSVPDVTGWDTVYEGNHLQRWYVLQDGEFTLFAENESSPSYTFTPATVTDGEATVMLVISDSQRQVYDTVVKTFPMSLSDVPARERETVTVMPNPTSGSVRVSADQNIQSIRILNADGKLLNTVTVQDKTATLDLGRHEGSLFLLDIRFQNGSSVVKKVVKG